MYLETPSINEVINCIGALGANKAVGHDNIPAHFLKIGSLPLAPYLSTLIDFAFTNGIFLESCKTAKITLIHKKGERINPNKYRPIPYQY